MLHNKLGYKEGKTDTQGRIGPVSQPVHFT